MAESVPTSEFDQRFKARIEAALRTSSNPNKELHAVLLEMVKYISGNIYLREDVRDDAVHDVWMHVVSLTPKAYAIDDPTSWFRVSINHKFWQVSRRHNQTEVIPLRLDQHRNKRKQRLGLLSPQDINIARRFFDSRIVKAVQAYDEADSEELKHEIKGMLRGLQESRRYLLQKYKPCEISAIRYTRDDGIAKE